MLSRPTFAVWLISTVLAVLVILITYSIVSLPQLSFIAANSFETLLLAYILLWLGTIVSGL